MIQATVICFVLFMQDIACALYFALDNAGNSIAAKIAMIAMTTRSSIKVNPRSRTLFCSFVLFIWFLNSFRPSPRRIDDLGSALRLQPINI